MVQPSFQEFKKLAKKKKLIPVYTEFISDSETPVTLFSKLNTSSQSAFLFESAEVSEKVGHYSFIGIDPSGVLELRNDDLVLIQGRKRIEKKVKTADDIFKTLKKLIEQSSYIKLPGLPTFLGGLVGFISYEFVRYCEDIKISPKKGLKFPDFTLLIVDTLVIYDHFTRKIQIVHLTDPRKGNLSTAYKYANAIISEIENKIKTRQSNLQLVSVKKSAAKNQPREPASNTPKLKFESAVKKIKLYIKAGDCIQAVLSQRFSLGKVKNDFLIYRVLRTLNPSPYMFYFKHDHLKLIGSSPETFVKKRGTIAETRPIAGTRPRGQTEALDQKMEDNLRASVKEMAEHLMLVDLGRNDLGRVCSPKTVRVSEFAKVERYSHVMHLVSNVEGKLKQGMSALDLFKACFPAGTVSGAPKIRAMQIIDELEREERGPYAGAVGYFDFNGDMDFCITIRTIAIHGNQAYIQAGAGIVNDSNPKREYQETKNKAKALVQAVRLAGSR